MADKKKKDKSVLDGVPVKEKGFPLHDHYGETVKKEPGKIICPHCGQSFLPPLGIGPVKKFEDTIHTK